ncbi:MAG: ImmA/IrrE family metallo-endopeptidase [Cellulosilyticaceae bacterium]
MDIPTIIKKLTTTWGTCDPFRLCKFLDIDIIRHPLGKETRGLIHLYKRNYVIYINSDLDELEQIHTCAHELGHFMLHKNINTLFMKTCTYLKTDNYEIEANEFAFILLNALYFDIQI